MRLCEKLVEKVGVHEMDGEHDKLGVCVTLTETEDDAE